MNQTITERVNTDRGVQHPPPISISVETIRPMFEALGVVEDDWPRLLSVEIDMQARRVTVVRQRQFRGAQTQRVDDGKKLCETFEVEVTR